MVHKLWILDPKIKISSPFQTTNLWSEFQTWFSNSMMLKSCLACFKDSKKGPHMEAPESWGWLYPQCAVCRLLIWFFGSTRSLPRPFYLFLMKKVCNCTSFQNWFLTFFDDVWKILLNCQNFPKVGFSFNLDGFISSFFAWKSLMHLGNCFFCFASFQSAFFTLTLLPWDCFKQYPLPRVGQICQKLKIQIVVLPISVSLSLEQPTTLRSRHCISL